MKDRPTNMCTFAFPSSEYTLALNILHFYTLLKNVYLGSLSHSEPKILLLVVFALQHQI